MFRDNRAKRVDTINEATGGELLSEKDFAYIGTVSFASIPLTTYRLECPGYWNESYPGDYVQNHEPFTIDENITSIPSIRIPILKGCFIKELAVKWYHAQLYKNEAQSYKQPPKFKFQKTVMLYARAAELYENLVIELLPLFKEEDRDIVKFRMLADTVGACASGMASHLSSGMLDDIKSKKKAFGITNVPQKMIDIWIEYCNLTDAWIAKSLPHRKENQLYKHLLDLKNIKAGIETEVLYRHPNNTRYSSQWDIESPTKHLNDFLKERELAINPPLQSHEKISVKVHPLTIMFSRKAQQASDLIANARGGNFNSQDSERVKLLDKLAGYIPIYTAPKAMGDNVIDKDIIQKEKELIDMLSGLEDSEVNEPKIIAPKNITTLLEATNKGIELLSLVHMRYKTSVGIENDYTYFNWFNSSSAIDKDTYYEIFASYMKNIFNKCLTPLLEDEMSKSDVYKVELENAKEAAKSILEFSHDIHNIDTESAKGAVSIFRNIQILCGHETVLLEHNVTKESSSLRHRHPNRIECI